MREVVPRALDGERLDRVVALVTGGSRSEAAALVDDGAVTVGGSRRHGAVAPGRRGRRRRDRRPRPPAPTPSWRPTPPSPFRSCTRTPTCVVVDKPAGLVVHPGAGQTSGTLVNGLLARYPEIRAVGQPDRPGIVHRLDKGTSGCWWSPVAPRPTTAWWRCSPPATVDRRYRALVWGTVASPTGLVDAPIGRSGRDPTRMAVTVRGKPARTRYDVVRTFHQPVAVTELRCRLETGRTHQIRVHLASIGHPVVGDARYGGDRQSLPLPRPFLHAERAGLRPPDHAARRCRSPHRCPPTCARSSPA